MTTLPRPMAIARFLVILALVLQGRAVAEASAPQRSIQSTMHEFFQALTTAFPLSLDARRFQAPEHRQRIQAALRTLTQHVSAISLPDNLSHQRTMYGTSCRRA